jgi:hypothetical protein
MKTYAIFSKAFALGPFLTLILLSRSRTSSQTARREGTRPRTFRLSSCGNAIARVVPSTE